MYWPLEFNIASLTLRFFLTRRPKCEMIILMIKDRLLNPTDAQLNVAFSIEIAGWHDVYYEEDEEADIDSRTVYPWKGMAGLPPDGGKRRLIPPFSTYFEAVRPWLEKLDEWDLSWSRKMGYQLTTRLIDLPCPEIVIIDKSLARAATIALLRAHGVEIEFTKEAIHVR